MDEERLRILHLLAEHGWFESTVRSRFDRDLIYEHDWECGDLYRRSESDPTASRRHGKRWRGVVGDIAIVVVGVMIALAADAWWQGLEDKRREQQYLGALAADVASAKSSLALRCSACLAKLAFVSH